MQSSRPILLALLVSLVTACASSRSGTNPAADVARDRQYLDDEDAKAARRAADPKPIADIVERTRHPESIGKVLADLDETIKAWNNLFLTAQSPEDQAKARNLEKAIMSTAHARRAEIVEQLEGGPVNNRVVAAMALGFTREPEAQSPLLAALHDTDDRVVANALLGLWLMARADTPLDEIARLVRDGRSEDVRANAALCLATLAKAGARGAELLPAARVGLEDTFAAVRAHCAFVLAELVDSDSLVALADRLYDDTPLVVAAAARAISYIGQEDGKVRGQAARALVTAWIKAPKPGKAVFVRPLIELAGSNYGSDEDEWSRWAARLP